MKYEAAAPFRQALETRLQNEAARRGTSIVRLRKLVTFDRLLARLSVAASGRWVLKGALAIEFRTGVGGRATRDVDLARADDARAALADFEAAQRTDLGDHFLFVLERSGAVDAEDEPAGARYRATAELAGRPFETVLVDVAFSDPQLWAPELVRGPDLLAFAGIEPSETPTLPLEQHLAEKVHAYTRTYAGGRRSSRVKDLADMVLLRTMAPLDVHRVRLALDRTFDARGTHPLPRTLPPPPRSWRVPYRRLASDTGIEEDLDKGFSLVAELVDPVLGGEAVEAWDPEVSRWIRAHEL